ncbi:MAG TPA: secondary thiamine-phosphate synthase enzyme YjbQ, partial [Candidatus Saccharimonadia bacterium]
MNFQIHTHSQRQVVDLTDQIEEQLPAGAGGVVVVTVLHTTAAVTTADLDPGTDLDLLDFLQGIIPTVRWRHPHNPAHAPAHLLSSVVGPSVTLPVQDGSLVLGTWQRVVLIELA